MNPTMHFTLNYDFGVYRVHMGVRVIQFVPKIFLLHFSATLCAPSTLFYCLVVLFFRNFTLKGNPAFSNRSPQLQVDTRFLPCEGVFPNQISCSETKVTKPTASETIFAITYYSFDLFGLVSLIFTLKNDQNLLPNFWLEKFL